MQNDSMCLSQGIFIRGGNIGVFNGHFKVNGCNIKIHFESNVLCIQGIQELREVEHRAKIY